MYSNYVKITALNGWVELHPEVIYCLCTLVQNYAL